MHKPKRRQFWYLRCSVEYKFTFLSDITDHRKALEEAKESKCKLVPCENVFILGTRYLALYALGKTQSLRLSGSLPFVYWADFHNLDFPFHHLTFDYGPRRGKHAAVTLALRACRILSVNPDIIFRAISPQPLAGIQWNFMGNISTKRRYA